MKTLLTKCLARVKGCFGSPATPGRAELKIYREDGTSYPITDLFNLQSKLNEADARIEDLERQLRNASHNEGLLASRIGRFQAAHPGLHSAFFTNLAPVKRKGKQ